jgi:hypothetical protein
MELYHFSIIVQRALSYRNTEEFNEKIVLLHNGLEMNSKLATEIVKKLLYFLKDGSVDSLLYELGESHSRFSAPYFSSTVQRIFDVVNTRFVTSDTFRHLYLNAGIQIQSINDEFNPAITPSGFVEVSGYFRPERG